MIYDRSVKFAKYKTYLLLSLITSAVMHFVIFNLSFSSDETQVIQRTFDIKIKASRKAVQNDTKKEKLSSTKAVSMPVTKQTKDSAVLSMSFDNQILNFVAPKYPNVAKRRGLNGLVEISLTVLENGKVSNVMVIKESKYPVFNKAVLDVAKSWTFKPAKTSQTYTKKILFEIE